MTATAYLLAVVLGLIAFAKWTHRFVVIQDEREPGRFYSDNVIQFPVRRRA